MARKIKRGDPVIYYGGALPQRCYFGGKMGAYRVLSSTPNVQSGWCVPLEKIEEEVFHAPNGAGVYEDAVCDRIEYKASKIEIVFRYVQAGPASWAIGSEVKIGDRGIITPVSVHDPAFETFEDAMKATMTPVLLELGRFAAGVDSSYGVGALSAKPLQRRAKDALFHLLHALPSPLQRDIIILLSAGQQK